LLAILIDGFPHTRPPKGFDKLVRVLSALGWNAVAYGAGKYVAVGGEFPMGTKEVAVYDASTAIWTKYTVSGAFFDSSVQSIAYGAGKFIMLGFNYGTGAAQSTNGVTWTSITLPPAVLGYGYWGNITYVQNKFILADSYAEDIYSSTDAVTWTLGTGFHQLGIGSYGFQKRIAYGAGKYVSIREGSSGQVKYSTDAITWSTSTLGNGVDFGYWGGVTYGNGYFVTANAYYNQGARSTDAVTWTTFTLPGLIGINGPTIFANGRFVILSANGYQSSETEAYTSTDAITWTLITLPNTSDGEYLDVVYGGTGQSSISSTRLQPIL